jgi:hypothetical protein
VDYLLEDIDPQMPKWYKEREDHPKFDGPISGLGTKRLNGMDIADFLELAGFTEIKELGDAIATFSAESLFYMSAFHHNVDDAGKLLSTDWGFPQINDKAHPEFFPNGDATAFMDDPQAQAKAAFKVYAQSSYTFNPWAAHTSGIWLDDYHLRRSSLALLNSNSRRLVALAKARPAEINGRATPTTKTPTTLITTKQFNTIYPFGT